MSGPITASALFTADKNSHIDFSTCNLVASNVSCLSNLGVYGGITTLSNALNVYGVATLSNAVVMSSNLNVFGNTTLSNINFTGALTQNGAAFVSGGGGGAAVGTTSFRSNAGIWDYSGSLSGYGGPVSSARISGSNVVASALSPFASAGSNADGSIYFSGVAGSYLTVPGQTDVTTLPSFTIECWINIQSYPLVSGLGSLYNGCPYLIGHMTAGSASASVYTAFGVGGATLDKVVFYSGNAGGGLLTGATTIALNTWTHIAVSHNATTKTCKVFVDGTPDVLTMTVGTAASGNGTTQVTLASTITTGGLPLVVGQVNNIAFKGYVSNLRYTQQVLYTAAFTPSTVPLQVIDTTTKLLLRAPMETALTVTNPVKCVAGLRGHSLPSDALIYADCYGTNLPNLSGASAPTFDTTQAMCIRFDRTKSQYLQFPPQTFNIGTQGFTSVCKFAWTGAISVSERLFDFGNGATADNIMNYHGTGAASFLVYTGASYVNVNSSTDCYQNEVYTLVTRYDPFTNNDGVAKFGTMTSWVNGVLSSTAPYTAAMTDRTLTNMYVGKSPYTVDPYINADIYAFAVYNRALSDKEIQDASATLMATTTGLPREVALEVGNANGKPALAVKADGALSIAGPLTCTNDQSYAPVDAGVNKFSISGSIVGSVPATASSPFGPSAGDGSITLSSGNYMTLPNKGFSWWTGGGFTVEAWVNYSSFASAALYSAVQSSLLSDGGPYFTFGPLVNGTVTLFYYTTTNVSVTTTATVPLNTWTHIAATYDGTTIRVFINGVLGASAALSGTPNALHVGSPYYLGVGAYTPAAAVTNVRIVQGAALYTAAFTPSTSPLGPAASGTTALLLRVPQNPGKLLVKQIGGTSTVQAYPPAALTGNSTIVQNTSYGAGTYVASCSDFVGASFASYAAFDTNNTTYWQVANNLYATTSPYAYVGTTTTSDRLGVSYAGCYLQIQLPIPIVMSSYYLNYPMAPVNFSTPNTWYILGSNDGQKWDCIQVVKGNTTATTLQVSNSTAYSYYRMVIYSTNGVYPGPPYYGPSINSWTLYGTQSSINIAPDGQVGLGVTNPVQALEVAGNAIVSGNISAGNLGMFRNRIINGNMAINQRGITTGTVGSGSKYTADRWQTYTNTGSVTYSNITLANTDAPFQCGFRYSQRYTILTAISATTGNNIQINQPIESYNIQDFNWGQSFATPITLSFWSRTNGITKLPVTIVNYTGTYSYNTDITVTANTTWQYNTATISIPPVSSVWDVTNDLSNGGLILRIGSMYYGNLSTANTWAAGNVFGTSASTIWTTTVGNYVEFTGVQLEKGPIATPFEFRPYAMELQLCQRYYYRFGAPNDMNDTYLNLGLTCGVSTTSAVFVYKFPFIMRFIPSMNGGSSGWGINNGVSTLTLGNGLSASSVQIACSGSGISPCGSYLVYRNNNSVAYLEFNAEL